MKILSEDSKLKRLAQQAMQCAKHDIRENLMKELHVNSIDLNIMMSNFWE